MVRAGGDATAADELRGLPNGHAVSHLGVWATVEGSPGIAAGQWEQAHSRKFAWTRLFRPMVAGHPLTPLTRLAFVGDVTSSLTHWGTGGLRYINADYTVTASRLPSGEYVGLAAQSHFGTAGVATGSAILFDQHGPIGTASALALAQPA